MKEITLGGQRVALYALDTVVVGSGCAGFNAADTLFDLGRRDIALLTEAEALLRSLAGETRELALKLDRGEVDAGAARTLLNLSASRLEDALTRLRNVPARRTAPSPPACWR